MTEDMETKARRNLGSERMELGRWAQMKVEKSVEWRRKRRRTGDRQPGERLEEHQGCLANGAGNRVRRRAQR